MIVDAEYQDTAKDIDALIAKVFKNGDGKKLLEFLDKRFIRGTVCVPGQVEGQGYYREGQNSVIRYFQTAIARQARGAYKK
jgi:hypothetical protein